MTTTEVYPDVEGGLRTWLRAQTAISTLVSSRVFFGVPESTAFPLITVQRIGGGPLPGESFLDNALVQIDCWANGKNKSEAAGVATAVMSTLHAMTPQVLASGVYGYGASVDSVIFFPDPADGRARYVITASVVSRAA